MVSSLAELENRKYRTIPKINIMEIETMEKANIIVVWISLGLSFFSCLKYLFFTFFVLRSELRRRYAKLPFKHVTEIVWICISYLFPDNITFFISLQQKSGSSTIICEVTNKKIFLFPF